MATHEAMVLGERRCRGRSCRLGIARFGADDVASVVEAVVIVFDLARADAIGQVTGWHPAPSRPLPSFRDDRRQPRPMPRMIEFRVLGPVEVVRDGNAVALGGPRQRVLLALLLVGAPRPVPLDRLADELWHGEPPDGASTTIRAYVSKLRTVLGADAAITSSTAGYALDVGGDAVDANRFERLAREGHEALERGATRTSGDAPGPGPRALEGPSLRRA